MDTDRYRLPGEQSPPGPELGAGQARGQARKTGLRRVRHMSNWTAAALLVGTGATTAALASHALPVSTSASSSYSAQSTTAPGVQAPHVSGAVATSGGSGVTVTRTTHVVNGKPVVTVVKHAATYHDH